MQHFHARLQAECLGEHVRHTAKTEASIGNFSWSTFCQRDELLQGRGRHGGMDGQKILGIANERYRREVAHPIGKPLKGHDIHRKSANRTNKKRVAVRRRARRLLRRNYRARARPVVDDDRLFEAFAEFLSEDLADDIEGASRSGGHENVNWSRRIRLGASRRYSRQRA